MIKIFNRLFNERNKLTPQTLDTISQKNSSISLNLSKEESLIQLNLRKDIISSLCLEKKS